MVKAQSPMTDTLSEIDAPLHRFDVQHQMVALTPSELFESHPFTSPSFEHLELVDLVQMTMLLKVAI
jgi:hypothetical protein